ncbi:MAG: response regulator [Chloroflexota bacterium]|nr:response regulator [Chloroflexota bacterium]
MKILLVEDDEALADVIARNLRARGHQVSAEETAEAALIRMTEGWPDVLVLDVNLPDLTGWDILRRLSPIDRGRVRVVVISAAPISQKRIDEFKPDHTLQKPFPIDALVRAIIGVAPSRAPEAEGEI